MENEFQQWLLAGAKVSSVKSLITDLERDLQLAMNAEEEAKELVRATMAETGEYEVKIEGEYCNYVIYYTTPRESVKVENADAVPDDFCKIERKPKLKEIKEHIEAGNEVNWVAISKGEPKLTYKITKK